MITIRKIVCGAAPLIGLFAASVASGTTHVGADVNNTYAANWVGKDCTSGRVGWFLYAHAQGFDFGGNQTCGSYALANGNTSSDLCVPVSGPMVEHQAQVISSNDAGGSGYAVLCTASTRSGCWNTNFGNGACTSSCSTNVNFQVSATKLGTYGACGVSAFKAVSVGTTP